MEGRGGQSKKMWAIPRRSLDRVVEVVVLGCRALFSEQVSLRTSSAENAATLAKLRKNNCYIFGIDDDDDAEEVLRLCL